MAGIIIVLLARRKLFCCNIRIRECTAWDITIKHLDTNLQEWVPTSWNGVMTTLNSGYLSVKRRCQLSTQSQLVWPITICFFLDMFSKLPGCPISMWTPARFRDKWFMTLYDHGCSISKPFKTQFQSEHSELLACVDHNQDSSIFWFVASSSPHLLLLVSMGFNPFIRGAIGCTSPAEVFFNAMLEGGNNNKPPIWDLFYTTYKHCVIWRMNYLLYI